ncbi:MAG: MAPEG family protein [Burkholderiaceae bacterium]
MSTTFHWPALVTLATLLLLLWTGWMVARARGTHKVPAPATTGPEPFERVFRAQMNTVENAVLFLPALWLAAIYFSPRIAAIIGAIWVAARFWYAFAYARNAKARHIPFTVSLAATLALIAIALWGVLTSPLW